MKFPVTPGHSRLRGGRWVILTMVIGILAALAIGPGIGTAAAGGYDCKEVPAPESPSAAEPATFDPDSAGMQDPTDHTGYGGFGWAGLTWYTYDLGCGEDITRSPKAVGDTALGNSMFRIGQDVAAVALWLDRQASTPDQAAKAGRVSFLAEFDKLIVTITHSMKDSVYGRFMALALCAAGLVIIWRALRADVASVTKGVLLGGTALMLGALFVGAPQQAIKISDDTFAQMITDQQSTIFSKTGTTAKPRDVLLDQILLPDYTRGWFGDLNAANSAQLEPKIRDSLALSYDQQEQIRKDPKAADKIRDEKKKEFQDLVSGLQGNGLSYYTFQGKDSHRVSIGAMSMTKVSTISLLWIGASLLKLAALLAIRLAILTAPLWIPIAAVSGGLMERVLRGLLAAYLWGVAAATLLAVYMLFVVRLYTTDVALSSAWKFWVMLLMTVFCWMVMRPFKRISNIARQTNASVMNRSSMRRKARALTEFVATRRISKQVVDRTTGEDLRKREKIEEAQKRRRQEQQQNRRQTEENREQKRRQAEEKAKQNADKRSADKQNTDSQRSKTRPESDEVLYISEKGQPDNTRRAAEAASKTRVTPPVEAKKMVMAGGLWVPESASGARGAKPAPSGGGKSSTSSTGATSSGTGTQKNTSAKRSTPKPSDAKPAKAGGSGKSGSSGGRRRPASGGRGPKPGGGSRWPKLGGGGGK